MYLADNLVLIVDNLTVQLGKVEFQAWGPCPLECPGIKKSGQGLPLRIRPCPLRGVLGPPRAWLGICGSGSEAVVLEHLHVGAGGGLLAGFEGKDHHVGGALLVADVDGLLDVTLDGFQFHILQLHNLL